MEKKTNILRGGGTHAWDYFTNTPAPLPNYSSISKWSPETPATSQKKQKQKQNSTLSPKYRNERTASGCMLFCDSVNLISVGNM